MALQPDSIKSKHAVDKTKRKFRGKAKGRVVDPRALADIRGLLGNQPRRRDLLIEFLHLIQDKYGHISAPHVVALASEMKLAPVEVYEVATFYHHFDVIKENETAPPELTVRVCDSVTCEMFGCDSLIEQLQAVTDTNVRIQRVPCVGRCQAAPIAVVGQNPVEHATCDNVMPLVKSKSVKSPLPDSTITLQQYKAAGGYELYAKVVSGEIGHEAIIEILEHAGLRGLGGAGFPAGRKWRIVSEQPGPRLLAVNIDEGEPGTFKDRYYLERDPHRMFEGCLIAMHVVGLDEGYIYIRDEYPAIIEICKQCISQLTAEFGESMPTLHIRRGAGAYICGEESAMIESIEGKRGLPRKRPPYIAQVGLFGRPTLEHNCETLYWVRDIVEKGAEWFSSHGRRERKGLRSFSVSGRVKKPGVHLAPAGISIRELIDEYCGGMLDGHEFYGYFPGGASGGILPASLGDLPLDFGTLEEYGCFIGSAAVIVLSDKDSAKQAALNAMRFFAHESCGQCTPCRVGTIKAADIMQISWDKPLLDDLSTVMRDASICGLGQAAPNPMECVYKYFPHELES
jgi:formate dehydrogenase beta subunit